MSIGMLGAGRMGSKQTAARFSSDESGELLCADPDRAAASALAADPVVRPKPMDANTTALREHGSVPLEKIPA